MTIRRELIAFSATLAAIVGGFFAESLIGGKVLSPADVLYVSRSFRDADHAAYEPANRLLIDPVLQFQPWIEFNRSMLRAGRLPLWNSSSGCGVPHLANGQSAVFDPFQAIAYLGSMPDALAGMAAARLWFAGLGMFLLTRAWGYGPWGRWFSGLMFPFCGFLVVWLLFPVTNAAIWLPWVLLATDRTWDRPTWRSAAWLGLAVGGTLLGGHVQTSAHVLLAAGVYATWKAWRDRSIGRGAVLWTLGIIWGITIAAIEVVPLGFYLAKSPVWGDRDRERTPAWVVGRPRVLDAVNTALPSLYGSQRQGEPNLAKALGVHNQNESAGGFAGLATLIWLAPLAWSSRQVQPRVRFLVGLTVFGMLGAFRFAPVDNLLRSLPVINVTDNRRLTLWVAFGLVALGGIGLDGLASVRLSKGWRAWGLVWAVVAMVMLGAAGCVSRFEPQIRSRAIDHYSRMAEQTPGADPSVYRERAERQVREAIDFVPRMLVISGAHGLILAGFLFALRRQAIRDDRGRLALLGLAMLDVLSFGFGLNPAIDRADDRPSSPVIEALRREVGDRGRIIGIGGELPPNVLMRYGLADARNYDSVELTRNLDWLAPLYDPSVMTRSSRREITWARVLEGRDRLREAGVMAVVGPTRPPASGFDRVERVGEVWVAWLKAMPLVSMTGAGSITSFERDNGRLDVDVSVNSEVDLIVRETYDRGWRSLVDGKVAEVVPFRGTFLSIRIPSGSRHVSFIYDPIEVRWGLLASVFAALAAVFTLTSFGLFRSSGDAVERLGRTQAFGLESDS